MTHASSSAAGAFSRSGEALRRRLDAARAEEHGHPEDLVLVRLDAPRAPAEALLQTFAETDGVLWSPLGGPCTAGLGAAHVICANGASRFHEVRRRAADLWRRTRGTGASAGGDGPRLFGGFAFSATGSVDAVWDVFGRARFVLPRVTYTRHPNHAALTLAIERFELERGAASHHVQLFQAVYEALLSGLREELGTPPVSVERSEPDRGVFERRVEDAVRRIRQCELEKVVAARQVQLSFVSAIDPVATLIALRDQAPECARFMFRSGDAAFIGAPPELLVRKQGRSLETEALAGTIDADEDRPEHRLQASAKDLEEHALVVRAITGALAPLCDRTELELRPGVRRLKRLLHLCTPIRARLREDAHVLDLVECLHPTPAVGGVPTARALDWIERSEPFERGWYSGAVGWFDAQGDGEFNVALRSGLIRRNIALLYAGAGIVRESAAAAEYNETTLKLAAMLTSLRARA